MQANSLNLRVYIWSPQILRNARKYKNISKEKCGDLAQIQGKQEQCEWTKDVSRRIVRKVIEIYAWDVEQAELGTACLMII